MTLEWESVWGEKVVFEDIDAARARLLSVETKYSEMLDIWHSDAAFDLDDKAVFEGKMDRLAMEGSVLEAQIECWERQAA